MAASADARILVVDDLPYVRDILCHHLSDQGYSCDDAGGGEEALRLLDASAYALLITDIKMPGMSGTQLLAAVKERHPDVAVIMVTGVDLRSAAIECLEMGAYGYVMKPFEPTEVLISVAGALERRRLDLLDRGYKHQLEEEVRARTAEVRRSQEEITLRLVVVSEFRDNETGSHIRRMGRCAASIAEAVGWDPQQVADIRLAAPMHDIGKIGIPDHILLKPGRYTETEFGVMKTHARLGAEMLGDSEMPLLQMARDIALCHHERWDGSGYPHGLGVADIPECARITAIADVYDALRTPRVYRPPLSEEKAMQIMLAGRGSHFDPNLLDCFLGALPEIRQAYDDSAMDQDGEQADDPGVRRCAPIP